MSEPEPCWPEGEEAPWALAGLNALSANRQLLTRTVDSASSSVAGRSRPSLCKCSGAGFRLSMTPSTQRRGREAEVTPARRGTAMAGLPCRLRQARVPSRRVERRPGCPSRRFVSVGPVGPCRKQFAVCTALGLGRSARGLPSPRCVPEKGPRPPGCNVKPRAESPPAHCPRGVQICAHAGTGQFLNLSLSVALSDSLCLAPSLPSSPHAHAYFKTRTCKFPKANHITTS